MIDLSIGALQPRVRITGRAAVTRTDDANDICHALGDKTVQVSENEVQT